MLLFDISVNYLVTHFRFHCDQKSTTRRRWRPPPPRPQMTRRRNRRSPLRTNRSRWTRPRPRPRPERKLLRRSPSSRSRSRNWCKGNFWSLNLFSSLPSRIVLNRRDRFSGELDGRDIGAMDPISSRLDFCDWVIEHDTFSTRRSPLKWSLLLS